jgi:ABC-type branched-subunit amino acid transport system substrate-binding protein
MWLLLALLVLPLAGGDVFTLGYLTGSQRRPGDQEYVRPGLSISGAISLAVAELNAGPMGTRGHRLQLLVAETRGEELASIARTAELWTQNVAAYIGPQETCVTEARMAAAFNLPMISYVSAASCRGGHAVHYHVIQTLGRAIAQAVSRRLPTAPARVQTRVWSCGIL